MQSPVRACTCCCKPTISEKWRTLISSHESPRPPARPPTRPLTPQQLVERWRGVAGGQLLVQNHDGTLGCRGPGVGRWGGVDDGGNCMV